MGFLDKKSRVIDVALTERGRELYALGQLDFAYFGLFDDGIDYDPWTTGSFSDTDIQEQIEAFPMLEAPLVRDVRGATAPLEPIDHLFTAAAGYTEIPYMDNPLDGSTVSLQADQRGSAGTYRRTGTSLAQISMHINGEVEAGNPGYLVRVYASGSTGIQALDLRWDLTGRRSYDPFIAVVVDDERSVDVATVANPSSRRAFVSPRIKR
jgi:hypothetical protein